MATQQPGQPGLPLPPPGPPYPPQVALMGGIPTPVPDDIVSAILLALFIVGAATHMTIFQVNRRREHKFIFSVLLFGFCMARIAALVMRIVLASRRGNINITIAANIFVAAGVLLLFIVNLLFAQRILRAYHPKFGWNRAVTWTFRFLFFSVIALLIMVITTSVHSYFTLDTAVRQKERNVGLFAGTYLAVLAFLPIPIVIASILFPREGNSKIDKFGAGRLRTKVRLLLFTSTLLSFGAGFRLGVNFSPRPLNNPAWYHSKAAFYCFNFVIELIVVYAYALARFDKRFHVPDGSSARGHYKGAELEPGPVVNTESEVFGGEKKGSTEDRETETEADPEPKPKYGYHAPRTAKRDAYYAKLEEERAARANV
ncbi:putative family c-likeg-protein-coupled receptor protein [Naviculisporaceae sp. PSN 640]